MKIALIIIVIVLGLGLIAGVGYYFYLKISDNNSSELNSSPTKTPTSTQSLSCKQAITKVKAYGEVVTYLESVPQAKFTCDHQEGDDWVIHVYEIVKEDVNLPSHTATKGWYLVKPSGEITNYM